MKKNSQRTSGSLIPGAVFGPHLHPTSGTFHTTDSNGFELIRESPSHLVQSFLGLFLRLGDPSIDLLLQGAPTLLAFQISRTSACRGSARARERCTWKKTVPRGLSVHPTPVCTGFANLAAQPDTPNTGLADQNNRLHQQLETLGTQIARLRTERDSALANYARSEERAGWIPRHVMSVS